MIPQLPRKWWVVGLTFFTLGAGLALGFRPLSGYWLQQRGGAAVVDLSRALPDESGGFACLAEPFEDDAVRARLTLAIDQLEQASRLLPQQAHLYYLLGRAYCMAGRYDQAAQVLPKFTELRPKNPQADLELGFALEKLCPPLGECTGLTTTQVWQRAGVLPEHLIANGEAARKKEDFAQAIEWYQRAERMGVDLRSAIAFVRYQAALKDGRDQEAYTALQEAVETDDGWANADLRFLAWYRYGRWYFEILRNRKETEATLLKAIEICPDIYRYGWEVSESYRLVGIVQLREVRFGDAIHNFEKALSVNPKNQWIFYSLGDYLYETTGDLEAVEQNFNKAIELSPHNIQLWKSIIRYWLQKGRFHIAQRFCVQAQQRNIEIDECLPNP